MDSQDATVDIRGEIREGLNRPQKEISSRFFYDRRGSELFEEITALEEYYLTRTELTLLERCGAEWIARTDATGLVEYGAGSARKTRTLLDAMRVRGASVYVPVDVSAAFLTETAQLLRSEYPEVQVYPAVGDFTSRIDLPVDLPERTLHGLLGSTIGNFYAEDAVALLRRIRALMSAGHRFLMGADLRPGGVKSVETLERAYNDAGGVTAAFNLNILTVLNRDFGTDFDIDRFRHHAYYAEPQGRIEMHLVASETTLVTVPGGPPIEIRAGESIRTEVSCKYDRLAVESLFDQAGLQIESWVTDDDALYSLVLATPV